MGELVELDVTTVEESVTVNVTEEGAVQISVVAETGPVGPAGPNSVTSATTSDGTAELVVDTLSTTNFLDIGSGNIFFGDLLAYNYETELSSANHRAALGLDDMALLPNDGTATIDVLNATVQGTLTADHIHGNLAGSVYAHVRAGENLAKGDPVYVSGSHGSGATLIPVVSKADASNAAKMPAVGVMDAAVSNNQNGHMVITGTITELDTNAYPVNTVLYVATGGGWTSTPPAANSQAVAIVERSNTNNGAVIVKVNGLASSGGNGSSDANKLVRYNSTGGASITGGTLTDMTYAGTAAFTSTTRPTSAGTGTPAATSLITRADGDARFSRSVTAIATTNQDATNTATPVASTQCVISITEPGTYFIETSEQVVSSAWATAGARSVVTATGSFIDGVAYGGSSSRASDTFLNQQFFYNNNWTTLQQITNPSQSIWVLRTGVITFTTTGTIGLAFSQFAAVSSQFARLQARSFIRATRIA